LAHFQYNSDKKYELCYKVFFIGENVEKKHYALRNNSRHIGYTRKLKDEYLKQQRQNTQLDAEK